MSRSDDMRWTAGIKFSERLRMTSDEMTPVMHALIQTSSRSRDGRDGRPPGDGNRACGRKRPRGSPWSHSPVHAVERGRGAIHHPDSRPPSDPGRCGTWRREMVRRVVAAMRTTRWSRGQRWWRSGSVVDVEQRWAQSHVVMSPDGIEAPRRPQVYRIGRALPLLLPVPVDVILVVCINSPM